MNEAESIDPTYTEKKAHPFARIFVVTALVLCAFVSTVFLLIASVNKAPENFPAEPLTISAGMGVRQIVNLFETHGFVRSSDLLYAFLVFEHDTRDIKAGQYIFETPVTTREIASLITERGPKEPLISITIPEGSTAHDIASIGADHLIDFDEEAFRQKAQNQEGFLFPDTYFVPKAYTTEAFLNLLLETTDERLEEFSSQIENSELSLHEIITLASILEREANSPESMRMVSGILLNRLAIDMPLQADATIAYALDTPLHELPPGELANQLRKLDSPYNTYLNLGLPPTPIGNPGIVAIKAVLEPQPSEYYYYLTDDQGNFHYAKTLSEHNRNIARYLR